MNGKRIYACLYLAWQPFTRLFFSFFLAGFVDSSVFGEWLLIWPNRINIFSGFFGTKFRKKLRNFFARRAGIV
jgi:hypothetical protein